MTVRPEIVLRDGRARVLPTAPPSWPNRSQGCEMSRCVDGEALSRSTRGDYAAIKVSSPVFGVRRWITGPPAASSDLEGSTSVCGLELPLLDGGGAVERFASSVLVGDDLPDTYGNTSDSSLVAGRPPLSPLASNTEAGTVTVVDPSGSAYRPDHAVVRWTFQDSFSTIYADRGCRAVSRARGRSADTGGDHARQPRRSSWPAVEAQQATRGRGQARRRDRARSSSTRRPAISDYLRRSIERDSRDEAGMEHRRVTRPCPRAGPGGRWGTRRRMSGLTFALVDIELDNEGLTPEQQRDDRLDTCQPTGARATEASTSSTRSPQDRDAGQL